MKMFSSTQISWSEPWFFLLRIREPRGWRRWLLLAIGFSVLVFLAIYFFAPARGLPSAIGISLACGFVLVALLDVVNIQREVTVEEDCIIVNSAGGRWFETLKFDSIEGVRLMRPEQWNRPWGAMVIGLGGEDEFLLAVPNKVSLETLANILHRLGVAVILPGWAPSESDTRIGTHDELELDPAAAQGEVSIQPIGDQEPPLITTSQAIVREIPGLGPLFLALIAAIAVGVYLFLNWSDTSVLGRCLYIGGALIAIVVTFLYMIMVGQFLAAAYGVRVARRNLRTRPNATFGGVEEDLVCVEIFDRESWTKVLSMSADYGLLKIDRQQSRLLFEGKKFRWSLPISALIGCRIEESIVGSEADTAAQRRYFVVIEAAKGDETWEAGMVYTRTEMGTDTSESRYKRAQLLFTQIAEAV
ncbi:hypothetical protein ACFL5Q_01250 [Planctomycetota bacterium]